MFRFDYIMIDFRSEIYDTDNHLDCTSGVDLITTWGECWTRNEKYALITIAITKIIYLYFEVE